LRQRISAGARIAPRADEQRFEIVVAGERGEAVETRDGRTHPRGFATAARQ
jgi:hypothetical protein